MAGTAALAKRIRFVRLVLVLILSALVVRLVDVQVFESSSYQRLASQELTVHVALPAVRGTIYDRNGQLLALSLPTQDVYADDFQIAHPLTEARALSPLLGVPVATLATELHQRSGYVALAKQLPSAKAKHLNADDFPGITMVNDSTRVDPNSSLAAPVLGTVNTSDEGIGGVEEADQRALAGRQGSETLLESPSGVALPQSATGGVTKGAPGTGLELTLDEPMQYETEQALAAEIEASNALSGVAIVMDVHTGQILSMANLVANHPQPSGAPADSSGGVSEAPSDLAVTQLYEPGSVFKLVTFSAALQDGLITPNSNFTVPDQIELDGSLFHDAEAHPTEDLTATDILAQSSNIGTSEIARDLGESRLLAQIRNLGFGSYTGLGLPGETSGVLINAAQWEPTDAVSLPIGQVDGVTAQQVLDAYNSVANGGVFVAPKLVRAGVSSDGTVHVTALSATRTVMSPATASTLTQMLEQVVKVGTGTDAVIPGYTVAGKTGTAAIPAPGGASYESGAYMASFVGFAPAVHPVFSAIVVLDRPTPIYGGSVAAPVFSQIMRYALHRYDIPTTPGAPLGAPQGTSASDQAQDIT